MSLGKFRSHEQESAPHVDAQWIVLASSIPLDESTARMKILRTLESLGCAVLRDGVYLLPDTQTNRAGIGRLKLYIQAAQGGAHVLIFPATDAAQDAEFRRLFDRSARYDEVRKTIQSLQIGIGISDAAAIAQVIKWQREAFENIVSVDFFGSGSRQATEDVLLATEKQINALMFPSGAGAVPRSRHREAFFRKTWVTRTPMLSDRIASSWLIRRFIDAEATLRLVEKSEPIPNNAITFGFEGAQFGSTTKHITFEELMRYFRLDRDEAIKRISFVVRAMEGHDLAIPEAAGFTTMIDGARRRTGSDYQFVTEAEKIFDMVYERYLNSPVARAVTARD